MKRELLYLLLVGMALSQARGSPPEQPSEPGLAWKFGELFFSPAFYPVVRDGKVYCETFGWEGGPFIFDLVTGKEIWRGKENVTSPPVIDCNYMIFPSTRGLICLSLDSKEPLWVSKRFGWTTSSPVIAGRKVLVTTGSYFASEHEEPDQNQVLCYDKLTGDMLWRFEGEGDMNSTPVVHGDMVLASSGEGNLYAIDLESSELLWKLETGVRICASLSPVIYEDCVLYACDSLYCLGMDGTILWRMNAELHVNISLSSSERRLYGIDGDDVVSIDLEKREIAWRYPNAGKEVLTHVSGSRLHFFGTRGGDIYCLSSDGVLLWKYHVENEEFYIPSKPVLSEGYLLMTSHHGDIFTFNLPGEWCYIEAEGLFADGKYEEAQGFYVKALEYYEEESDKEIVHKIKHRIAAISSHTEEKCAEWQNSGEKGIPITNVMVMLGIPAAAVLLTYVIRKHKRR